MRRNDEQSTARGLHFGCANPLWEHLNLRLDEPPCGTPADAAAMDRLLADCTQRVVGAVQAGRLSLQRTPPPPPPPPQPRLPAPIPLPQSADELAAKRAASNDADDMNGSGGGGGGARPNGHDGSKNAFARIGALAGVGPPTRQYEVARNGGAVAEAKERGASVFGKGRAYAATQLLGQPREAASRVLGSVSRYFGAGGGVRHAAGRVAAAGKGRVLPAVWGVSLPRGGLRAVH